MFWRVSRDGGVTVLRRLVDRARIVAVLGLLLAMLAPASATSGVPTSGLQSSCHAVGLDLAWPSVVTSHAGQCGDPAGTACSATACSVPGCMSVPLPALHLLVRHIGIILAIRFDSGDQPAAGIGASPGLRPPIRAIAA